MNVIYMSNCSLHGQIISFKKGSAERANYGNRRMQWMGRELFGSDCAGRLNSQPLGAGASSAHLFINFSFSPSLHKTRIDLIISKQQHLIRGASGRPPQQNSLCDCRLGRRAVIVLSEITR